MTQNEITDAGREDEYEVMQILPDIFLDETENPINAETSSFEEDSDMNDSSEATDTKRARTSSP